MTVINLSYISHISHVMVTQLYVTQKDVGGFRTMILSYISIACNIYSL